ncbi:MAG: hypothetical protein OEZ54_00430 [Gemmatimonadota bacterium]|nr:hypothetical protein [Gemmatimonadota bacterium]
MSTKTEQLQIRVTPAEKGRLRRLARNAGQDISGYVLARALPKSQEEFQSLLEDLVNVEGEERRFALAALNDFLVNLTPIEFHSAVSEADLSRLGEFTMNYVAAMVEETAAMKKLKPPRWAGDVQPSDKPWFATGLKSLRVHLLKSAPVAFKRRNIFVDSGVDRRV